MTTRNFDLPSGESLTTALISIADFYQEQTILHSQIELEPRAGFEPATLRGKSVTRLSAYEADALRCSGNIYQAEPPRHQDRGTRPLT